MKTVLAPVQLLGAILTWLLFLLYIAALWVLLLGYWILTGHPVQEA